MKAFFFVILYVVALSKCHFTVELQAEDSISTKAEKKFRSKAINGQTVLIKRGASLTLLSPVTGNNICQMRVEYISYSGVGPDYLTLTLNQASTTVLGTITTTEPIYFS